MNNRRSFFKRFAQAVAAVAVAPFAAKVVSMKKLRAQKSKTIEFFTTDQETADQIREAMIRYYQLPGGCALAVYTPKFFDSYREDA